MRAVFRDKSGKLHITKFSRFRRGSRVPSATPSHRAASAAKGKGSGGPVRRRRENETLSEIWHIGNPPSVAGE